MRKQQIDNDTLKAVSVRFVVNQELGRMGVTETEEMCQKTIAKLQWLNEIRPRCVLVADTQNKDPHAVMVRALGEKVAYIDRSQAPEIRGMLKETPRGMLSTTITEVNVYEHGYFFLRKPDISKAYMAEEIGVDWSRYQTSEPIMLPTDYFVSHDELSMTIFEELLPTLSEVGTEELRLYINRWLSAVRYNQSREVQKEMMELISILSADRREEVRQMAVDIDHLRTKKGTKEILEEMVSTWWSGMLSHRTVNDSFSVVKQRCQNDRRQLLLILGKVEQLMQAMPGDLYNDVGDAYEFFSRLGYLAPPMRALSGVLSLLAIRTLICNELGLSQEPFFGERVPLVTDVNDMPTTIGKVIDFAEKQCREYAEVLTVQRLADFLRQDYQNTRNEQIEGILDRIKPAPNINIGTLNGSATGQVTQEIKEIKKLIN